MGLKYLVPMFELSKVGVHKDANGALISGRDAQFCKSIWFNRYRPNFTAVIPPGGKLEEYLKIGYPRLIQFSNTPDPLGGPEVTSLEYKKKPVSNNPHWRNRHKNGVISNTSWDAYSILIERNAVPVFSEPINTAGAEAGYYYFDMQGNPLQKLQNGSFSLLITYRWRYIERFGVLGQSLVSDDVVKSIVLPTFEYDDGMITSVLADANQGYWDLLTEMAELPETIRWAYDLIGQATAATKAARNKEILLRKKYERKLMTAVEFTSAVASVWMQYRYAIKPLAYSLSDIQDVLLNYYHLFRTSRDFRDRSDNWRASISVRSSSKNLTSVVSISECKLRAYIKRSYEASSTLADLLRNYSINPVTTAWELVPLSFVADWFVNVGDFLAAWTGPNVHVQEVSTVSLKSVGTVTLFNEDNPGQKIVATVKYYDRRSINPVEHIALKFDPYIDWKRSLDALALLWGSQRSILVDLIKAPKKR